MEQRTDIGACIAAGSIVEHLDERLVRRSVQHAVEIAKSEDKCNACYQQHDGVGYHSPHYSFGDDS